VTFVHNTNIFLPSPRLRRSSYITAGAAGYSASLIQDTYSSLSDDELKSLLGNCPWGRNLWNENCLPITSLYKF